MKKISYDQTGPRPYLQGQVQIAPIPPPLGGWNAILPLAAMDPQYAPIMQNWVPQTGFITLRPGYSAWVQGLSTSGVESLMVYRPSNTSEMMFAATNGSIYDVTSEGISSSVQSGLSNNKWQYVNFTPSQGLNYLYMVNGQDAPRYYDGTSWTQPSITGGPTPSTFVNIAVWKRRIFFVEANSTRAWYLGTDAIQGSLLTNGNPNVIDIGAITPKGGKLIAVGSLQVSGGDAPDAWLVLVTSRGQVVFYKGTDPTNANAFSLAGVYDLPPPLGNRCLMQYGADTVLITLQGVIPLSQTMPVDSSAVRALAITKNIQNAMLVEATAAQNNFGWEMIHYPGQALIVLNVPINSTSGQQQYVMNAQTGAWTQFTGWQANTFAIFNDLLYFGDNAGNVNLAWSGGADLINPIIADMQCAFNYFGDPGRVKQITMIQPLLVTSGAVTPSLGIDVDFGSTSPTATVQTATPTGAEFGTALFGTATFAAGTSEQNLWQGAGAQGKALAVRIKVNLLPPGVGGTSVFDTGTFDHMVFDGFGTSTNTLNIYSFNAMIKYGGGI